MNAISEIEQAQRSYERDKRLHAKSLELLAIAHRVGTSSTHDLLWSAMQAANRGEVWKPAPEAAELTLDRMAKEMNWARDIIRYIEGDLA